MTACLLAPRSSIIWATSARTVGALLDGHFRQPVGEDPVRHGQREERPGDLEQLQPRVALADLLADTLRSHSATSSGTHSATANGKTSSRTFS